MAILDTDILIDYINGIESTQIAVDSVPEDQISTTVINQYELLIWADTDYKHEAVVSTLANLDIHLLDQTSAIESARIFKSLKKKGKMIPEPDIFIAGFVKSRDETLITRDKHFREIEGLRLIFV